jgi:rRNA-processing protein FCF1
MSAWRWAPTKATCSIWPRSGGIFGGEKQGKKSYKILDTSVIIDGRIADIAETGFLDGIMVIPQFVLRELQLVADSADSLKRNRGRRGLDILQRLQKTASLQIQIVEDDFPAVREVDMKLIELAKVYEGKIITNDFNLNKVAQLQGVAVLNINELANSLKPIVLPGEIMRVFILKEGKEYNQGVAYLDDGTMVVCDNARKMIGKTIDISVTSVLQTTAGKMIFGKWDERTGSRHDSKRHIAPAGHCANRADHGRRGVRSWEKGATAHRPGSRVARRRLISASALRLYYTDRPYEGIRHHSGRGTGHAHGAAVRFEDQGESAD